MSKNSTFDTEQLTDSAYYILLSLVSMRHGYGIMQYITQLTDGLITIGPATLYTLLKKMNQLGLINQVGEDGERKKQYQITKRGMILLENEVNRRRIMAAHGVEILDSLKGECICETI